MKTRSLSILAALLTSVTAVACGASSEEDASEAGDAVSTRNLGRNDFGLEEKELVLTLDDGPGPRTKELVNYLIRDDVQVPAVFFMVGKNAATTAGADAAAYVAANSHKVPGGLIVANHSNTHTTPLPKQGVAGSTSEIMTADRTLARHIEASQAQFGLAKSFFRPPYGAFTSLGAANIELVNQNGAAKYVGPIFWEVGGELNNEYSADWACWGKVTIERCQEGYVKEAMFRKKGIVLVHDVHSKTIDMLIGGNGRIGLIQELKNKGFKWVGLRSHEDEGPSPLPATPPAQNVTIRAESFPQADGSVDITAEAAGAASVVVYFDQDEEGRRFSSPASGTVRGRRFAPGQHTVRIVALDADGKKVAEQVTNFIVAAEIENDDGDNNSACVNYGALKRVKERGQYFDLYHGEVACTPDAPYQPEPGECYKFKGKQFVARLPEAIGPREWAVEYDLKYDSSPDDISTVSMVLETGTGLIQTGKRHAFRNRAGALNTRRANVEIDELRLPNGELDPKAIDCDKGVWRGIFRYPNGSTEKFRFSKPGQ